MNGVPRETGLNRSARDRGSADRAVNVAPGTRDIISAMNDTAHLAALVAGCAFALAFVFGAVAQRVSFCTMGAISDIVNFGDWQRMRMWILAIAVAVAGTAALQASA